MKIWVATANHNQWPNLLQGVGLTEQAAVDDIVQWINRSPDHDGQLLALIKRGEMKDDEYEIITREHELAI